MLDVDKALCKLGRFGCYQMMVFNLTTAVWTFCGLQMMSMAFTNTLPPFHCFPDAANGSVFDSACERAVNDSRGHSHTELCNASSHLVFDHHFGDTIASEWGLVCGRRWELEFVTSLFMLGVTVGAFVITPIADRFGRKWVLLGSVWALGGLEAVAAVVPSFAAFAVLRFLGGCAYAGASMVGWVLTCEVVEPGSRALSLIGSGSWWTLGYVLVGPLAYALPDWRQLGLACSLPVALTAVYIWLIPESPHWLAATQRTDEAVAWFTKAARWNGRRHFTVEDCMTARQSNEPHRRHLGHLFRSPVLVAHTLIMGYLWFCNTFTYYGLSLFSTTFAGDRYLLNFILSGLVELPANFVIIPMMNWPRLGRKGTVVIFHTIAGVSLLALTFIPPETGSGRSLQALSTGCWLVGKCAISASFSGIFVYGAELFPTTLRTGGMGLCNVASKVGAVLAPQIRLLSELSPSLPSLLFGGSSLLAAAVALSLPETVGRRTPEDLPDVVLGPVLGLCCRSKPVAESSPL